MSLRRTQYLYLNCLAVLAVGLTAACSDRSTGATGTTDLGVNVVFDGLSNSDTQPSDTFSAAADTPSDMVASEDAELDGGPLSGDATGNQDVGPEDASGADAPSADAPGADAPDADAPDADAPGADALAGDTSSPSSLWLVSIGAQSAGVALPKPTPAGSPLYRIDLATGQGKTICTIAGTGSYPSSTFARNGTLYASNNKDDRLDIVDPCTCKVTAVGKLGYAFIPGITSDQGSGLFGIENQIDILVTISTTTGKASKIGSFGVDFGKGGATWSDKLKGVYAIDGDSDSLFVLNPKTGAATKLVKLTKDFGTVGMELHPGNGVIYACTSDAILYTVNPKTGSVDAIGKMPHPYGCSNLAAPWGVVGCLDKP